MSSFGRERIEAGKEFAFADLEGSAGVDFQGNAVFDPLGHAFAVTLRARAKAHGAMLQFDCPESYPHPPVEARRNPENFLRLFPHRAQPEVVGQVFAIAEEQLIFPVMACCLLANADRVELEPRRELAGVINPGGNKFPVQDRPVRAPAAAAQQIVIPRPQPWPLAGVIAEPGEREARQLLDGLRDRRLEVFQKRDQFRSEERRVGKECRL